VKVRVCWDVTVRVFRDVTVCVVWNVKVRVFRDVTVCVAWDVTVRVIRDVMFRAARDVTLLVAWDVTVCGFASWEVHVRYQKGNDKDNIRNCLRKMGFENKVKGTTKVLWPMTGFLIVCVKLHGLVVSVPSFVLLLLFCRTRWLMSPDVPQPVWLIVLTLL
jgi:hypothetical protein